MSTVSPPHRRTARNPTATEKRSYRPWWGLAALLACGLILGAAVTGRFRVHHVDIVGATGSTESIVQTTGVMNQNIFTVRSDDVVRRLAGLRELDVQRVDTSFPDRVTVYVRMRRRFLAWQDGNTLYEVDPNGRIVGQVRSTRLPIIKGTSPGTALGPGIVQAVRYAAETLPFSPKGSVAQFQVSPGSGLVIVGRAGWTAAVGRGTPQTLVQRIAALAAILRSPGLRNRRLTSVDLRYPMPFLHYAGA